MPHLPIKNIYRYIWKEKIVTLFQWPRQAQYLMLLVSSGTHCGSWDSVSKERVTGAYHEGALVMVIDLAGRKKEENLHTQQQDVLCLVRVRAPGEVRGQLRDSVPLPCGSRNRLGCADLVATSPSPNMHNQHLFTLVQAMFMWKLTENLTKFYKVETERSFSALLTSEDTCHI